MKKIWMFFVLLLLLPTICFAETYKNQDYNFQLEIPDGWVNIEVDESKGYILGKKIFCVRNGKQYVGTVGLKITSGVDISKEYMFEEMSSSGKTMVLNAFIAGIKKNYPTFETTYSDVVNLGEHVVGLIKGDVRGYSYKLSFVLYTFNGGRYLFSFVTNDPDRAREPEFIEMIKSLKPIY